jgi:hypothetical protein
MKKTTTRTRSIKKIVACFILLNLKFEYGTGTEIQGVSGSRSHNKTRDKSVLQSKGLYSALNHFLKS